MLAFSFVQEVDPKSVGFGLGGFAVEVCVVFICGSMLRGGSMLGKGVDVWQRVGAWKIEGYYDGLCDLHNLCESKEIYARTMALDRGHRSLNKISLLCALATFQVEVKGNGIVTSDMKSK